MKNSKNKQENARGQSSAKSPANPESGRSLIEMLAVLAIIGVLVVLGLNLYWYALERYRTNALKAELGTMAITTSIKLSTSSNFKINGNLKYPFEGKFNDNQTFTITVSSIPFKICSRLRSEDWALPSEILINGAKRGPCQETNILAFSFNNSVYDGKHPELEPSSPSGGSSGPTKDPCRPCSEGCEKTCKTKHYWCWGDGCACLNGKTDPPFCRQTGCSKALIPIMDCEGNLTECCPDTFSCTQPTCCTADWVTVTDCDGKTTQCCPDDGNDCSNPECCAAGWVDIQNCDGTTTKCCPKKDGDCAQPSCCSKPWVKVTDCEGNVTDCCPDDGRDCTNPTCCITGTVSITHCDGSTTECCRDDGNVCENEIDCCETASDCPATGQVCVDHHCTCPTGQYRGDWGYGDTKCLSGDCCYSCNDATKTNTTKEECDRCSERTMMGNQCILQVDCKDKADTFMTDLGTCEPCSSSSQKGALEADCLSCNTATNIRRTWIIRTSGVPLCTPTCGTDKFRGMDTTCHSCTDPSAIETTESACSVCGDNRVYRNGKCEYALCNDTFLNNKNACIPCEQTVADKQANWLSTEEECLRCGDKRWYTTDGYCFPVCPPDHFQNANGNCTNCGLMADKATSAENCQKCENYDPLLKRVIKSGKCALEKGNSTCRAETFQCSTDRDAKVCRPCSDPMGYTSNSTYCSACDSTSYPRKMQDGKCVPK